MPQDSLPEKINKFDVDDLPKILAVIVAIAFAAMVIVYWVYFDKFNDGFSTDQAVWGAFGDFIGGTLNPLLSLFALIALLITIWLQSKELKATREELKRSAEAQELSHQALQKQSETLDLQQFEQTFFSLISQNNEVLKELSSPLPSRNDTKSGLQVVFTSVNQANDLSTAKARIVSHDHITGHYFRMLLEILKFIALKSPDSNVEILDESLLAIPVSEREKTYSEVLRATIPSQLLFLIAIYGYSEKEDSKYLLIRQLIERYGLLKYLSFNPVNGINKPTIHIYTFYNPIAFDNSEYFYKAKMWLGEMPDPTNET